MITVEEGRRALRISHNKLDSDIQELIYAATLDLRNAGVRANPEQTALINTAIKLYLRWQFDYRGKGTDYGVSYKETRDALALVTPRGVIG